MSPIGTHFLDDRIHGPFARTIGNLDGATAHFKDALAWFLCDYTDMLLERNSEGDRQKTMQLLDESLAISPQLLPA